MELYYTDDRPAVRFAALKFALYVTTGTHMRLASGMVYSRNATPCILFAFILADLTVSKRPGTSNRIEIHFAVFNHLYLCFSFMKLAETL